MSKMFFLIAIIFSIFFMSIGYSSLNTNLNVSGEAKVSQIGDIRITNVYTSSQDNDGYSEYNPTHTENQTSMFIKLPKQDSSVTVTIEVTNSTNDYYHLSDIIQLSNTNIGINYQFSDEKTLFFYPNSVTEIEVVFSHKWMVGTMNNTVLNLEYVFSKINYKPLDYITSTGTQFIDTGVNNTGDYIFETEFMIKSFTLNDGGWIFCGRIDYNYTLGVFAGNHGTFNSYGGVTTNLKPILSLDTWYPLYFSRSKLTIGDYSYTVSSKTLISNDYLSPIYLGGATVQYSGEVDNRHFNGHIKYFKIYSAYNNSLLKYFIPVKLLDTDEVGYIELVSNKFYSNNGTGNFLEP